MDRVTVQRFLKRMNWSRKKSQRMGDRQSNELRLVYRAESIHWMAEQLVFIDESLFNETTGWRQYTYAPVGQPGRYYASRRRGHSWSVLPAYAINGYLPCIVIKEGWFNAEQFYRWVADELLPCYRPGQIIIMDNASIHCNGRIEELIGSRGLEVRYLPPYSPDLNPIELTFSILKAWVRREFTLVWPFFQGAFSEFLRHAIENSHCDAFPRQHFRHDGYLFESDVREVEREFEAGRMDF